MPARRPLTPRQLLSRVKRSRDVIARLERASTVLGGPRQREELEHEAVRQRGLLLGYAEHAADGSQREAIVAMADLARSLERRFHGED
jgi:hypothetical protein